MTDQHRRSGIVFASAYLAVVVAACGYAIWRMTVTPGQSELAAMGLVALGLPWSLLATAVALTLGSSSAWLMLVGTLGGCALNAWLLYRFGSRRSKS